MNAEQIVKRLRHYAVRCDGVHACWNDVTLKAAADLIESLQMQVAERDKALDRVIETLTKELVAAVEDLHVHGGCVTCKFCKETPPEKPCERFHIDMDSPMIRCLSYLWRGPQEKLQAARHGVKGAAG